MPKVWTVGIMHCQRPWQWHGITVSWRQAKLFHEVAGVTGIILTKLDGTAKGGIALAIANEVGVPIKLISVGEQVGDLHPFEAREFAEALFGEL